MSPCAPDTSPEAGLQRATALAAFATLAAANLVGLLLAALLLWPDLGRALGPLTYGRWVPVHLNTHLYGWCSLPIIGLLLRRLLPPGATALAPARFALALWCGALLAGSVSWLAGGSSGKIFLDWQGITDTAFTIAQLVLWSVLAAGWFARGRLGLDTRLRHVLDAALLTALLAVPVALHLAGDPAVFPPVNPSSGGATGHSLYASSLAVVGLGLALPALLGVAPRASNAARRFGRRAALGFAAAWAVYALMPHGNASHQSAPQILALAALLAWPPVIILWFRHHIWSPAQHRWLAATAAWAVLLVVNGWILFLPGVLDGIKFTNALVAHSHLAMAGLLTSLNLVILASLAPAACLTTALAARGPFLLWNGSALTMIVALTTVGACEARDPLLVARAHPLVDTLYFLRLAAGTGMTLAGLHWLRSSLVAPKSCETPRHSAPSAAASSS